MKPGRAGRAVLLGAAVLALAIAAAVLLGPALGLFSGSRPANLGFAGGRFTADGDWRPNWVSSTAPAGDAKHAIAPLAAGRQPAAAWAALEQAIAAIPRATVVTRRADYLHVEFASPALGFVDDAEFQLDAPAGVIHVRSAARLGIRDFDVNRKRIETLRTRLAPGRR